MRTHYAITSTIRYYKLPCDLSLLPGPHPRMRVTPIASRDPRYWPLTRPVDVSRWADPPHVALANLRDEPEAVLRFTRTYGLLVRPKRKAASIPISEVLRIRDRLRYAWDKSVDLGDSFITSIKTTVTVWPHVRGLRAGLAIRVEELGQLIGMMYTRDLWEGRARKCESADCPAPYFRAVRRGQKFCSQRCAVLINVRRFREREGARKAKTSKHRKDRKGGQKGKSR
jgi:hypothetical protein